MLALNLNLQFEEYLNAVVRIFWMAAGDKAMQEKWFARVGLKLVIL